MNEDKKSILIDEKIHRKLAIYCAKKGVTIKDVLEKIIIDYLKSEK
jgi:macrodomain Ter protein organizer (MatP/YcbG family)